MQAMLSFEEYVLFTKNVTSQILSCLVRSHCWPEYFLTGIFTFIHYGWRDLACMSTFQDTRAWSPGIDDSRRDTPRKFWYSRFSRLPILVINVEIKDTSHAYHLRGKILGKYWINMFVKLTRHAVSLIFAGVLYGKKLTIISFFNWTLCFFFPRKDILPIEWIFNVIVISGLWTTLFDNVRLQEAIQRQLYQNTHRSTLFLHEISFSCKVANNVPWRRQSWALDGFVEMIIKLERTGQKKQRCQVK